ncbi:MAG TPA: hypothetical protein VJ862_04315 [Rhodanobacteraceae bacterium]|nr:hypothetical protein [Rhodanobacteraceae bacterium]
MRHARFCSYAFALVIFPLALAACVSGVNGSVDIAAGSSVSDATTVNGSVNLGPKAKARKASTVNGSVELADGAHAGEVSTVNGHVTLGQHASAGSVDTVNGAITLETGATVAGDVTAVNGALDLKSGSAVKGSLTNVNSHITVDAAQIGNGITTVNGDMDITGNAVVNGGIKVKKPNDNGVFGIHFDSDNIPRIVIGPGATVNGPLTFERPVHLYISDQAHVSGPITGAQAVKYSGTTPPSS